MVVLSSRLIDLGMDSRDSQSSASSMAVNRDGSSSVDEDAMISVAAALAKDAAVLFQSRKYVECVDVLNQLLQKKENDPKVLHNIAIAEYFRDGCSDPKKLLEVLNYVKTRSEELARASGEQAEAGGNKNVSGSKGTGTMANQFSAASSGSVVYADEFDTSVASLNIAIIWFHLHEHKKALSVLEPLYQNIGPIDETIALNVCLLLLDAALASHDASKAADLINYLDKAFNVGFTANQGDNGSMGQQPSSNVVTKSSSVPAVDASISDLAGSLNASENSLSRTMSDETIDYENLLSTLDISGDNLTRTAGLSSSSDLLRTPADRTMPTTTIDLKLKLQLYKVQFLLLTRNLKAVKREVKEAMNMARGRDSSMALLLKSQLEYARGNHRKAIKLLMASSYRTDPGFSSILNNNFGCIYYQLGKHHTSTVFFSKALSNSSSLRKDKPRKLSTFSQDKSLLIIYNCGMQYLACGKPVLAARCFQKASLVFHNQPLLWLRIAECCLMALEKGLLKSIGVPNGSEIRVNVIGKGKWRQLVVEDGVSKSRNGNSVEREGWFSGDDRQPKLSMSLARQCLTNALYLLNSSASKYLESGLPSNSTENKLSEAAPIKNSNYKSLLGNDSKASNVTAGSGQVTSNGDAKDQKGGTSLHELLTNSISDCEEICRKENRMIKQALLADLAYVELELENPVKALSTAASLLQLPECSRVYIFLGHVYAAEAFCLLNRPKEAAEHLLIYMSGESKVEFPYREEDCEQWRVEKVVDCEEVNGNSATATKPSLRDSQGIMFLKPEEARGTLYVNLAVMSAMEGELDQAHQFAMQALSILPNHVEAILTSVYVDLRLGKTQEALAKLKVCSRVRFLNSSS